MCGTATPPYTSNQTCVEVQLPDIIPMSLDAFNEMMKQLCELPAVPLAEIPIALHDDLRGFMSGKTWTEIEGMPAVWQQDFQRYWRRCCLFGVSCQVWFRPIETINKI